MKMVVYSLHSEYLTMLESLIYQTSTHQHQYQKSQRENHHACESEPCWSGRMIVPVVWRIDRNSVLITINESQQHHVPEIQQSQKEEVREVMRIELNRWEQTKVNHDDQEGYRVRNAQQNGLVSLTFFMFKLFLITSGHSLGNTSVLLIYLRHLPFRCPDHKRQHNSPKAKKDQSIQNSGQFIHENRTFPPKLTFNKA